LILEYFNSVNKNAVDFANRQNSDQLGKKIGINGRDDFNNYSNINIVIFSISEYRSEQSIQKTFKADKDFRTKLYSLYVGNWNNKVFDLGNLVNGNELSDTNYALERIIESFIKNKIFVITIGGSQSLTYNLYSSIKSSLSSVNLVTVDNKLDFTKNNNVEDSYLSKIILDDDNKLNQFSNIGFQKHLTSRN
jgi:arginase family enzyme